MNWRDYFWWSYLALVGAFVAIAMVLATRGEAMSVATLSMFVLDLIACGGLVAWRLGRAFALPGLWMLLGLLALLRYITAQLLSLSNLWPWYGYPEQRVALVLALSAPLMLPLIWGLYSYAFRSPQIWARETPLQKP